MNNKNKTFRSVLIALFCAIIIVQNFVPFFGYIPVGPLNLTTIHVTVIIAAIVLGPRDGAIIGGSLGAHHVYQSLRLANESFGDDRLCQSVGIGRAQNFNRRRCRLCIYFSQK